MAHVLTDQEMDTIYTLLRAISEILGEGDEKARGPIRRANAPSATRARPASVGWRTEERNGTSRLFTGDERVMWVANDGQRTVLPPPSTAGCIVGGSRFRPHH